ncbi:hypothetical protein IX49_13285 [Cellulophaga lytica]|uniref:hypothetical protein n=1 Tax=Cellulophaga lytica TaxID=979 RepID=UPI0004F74028|nr:hypothetical protein [Cellulophaga lytica]AIM61446.1 hypothetical protein IX49_13285 [Cellulophaga lytica]
MSKNENIKLYLKSLKIINNNTIVYDYTVTDDIKEYFNLNNKFYAKYDQNIADTPNSIAVIPFLANIMPIAWFVGFDVYIDNIDTTFYNSLKELKKQFIKFHPTKNIKGELHINNKIDTILDGNNTSLLFSGGLDTYDSYSRLHDKDPFLISIHGADVKIDDTVKWNKFVKFNSEEDIINHSKLFYVESNLREFYTYKVDLLVDGLGWWGAVQHGMALLGVLAPLSYKHKITDINIAASATNEVTYSWGSSPYIDENMKWANCKVTHNGYEFRRTEKTQNVVDFVNSIDYQLKLRVCYADERVDYNCNVCHKCQRTILSLILANANPKDYGFIVPSNFYSLLFKNFGDDAVMTKGLKYQWTCIQDKARETDTFFVIQDQTKEKEAITKFMNLDLDAIINKNQESVLKKKKSRFLLQKKYPLLYKIYKLIRYQKI